MKRQATTKANLKKAAEENKKKAWDFFEESDWRASRGQYGRALEYLEKAIKLDPGNKRYLQTKLFYGNHLERREVACDALVDLYNADLIMDKQLPSLCGALEAQGRYEEALSVAEDILARFTQLKLENKRGLKPALRQLENRCREAVEILKKREAEKRAKKERKERDRNNAAQRPDPVPDIPVTVTTDEPAFREAFFQTRLADPEAYELALAGHRIRFKESFDNLICLHNLKNVRSIWHQEETARKVLRRFRGRALLSDEVGLGKTIEACIVLKEYMDRGMVKSALILTPTPLVSQWKEELAAKFGIHMPSTDDPEYRTNGNGFWQSPFILASINTAKSKQNFDQAAGREFDMVIVDEAHHLKNRNTLNWKLVNALKKRFMLLLTATPVENNLMELFNLITLLKPGQLKTATAFKEEFMNRGDPTDPRNRGRLKELLGEVMIRNTRAVARINIPPRFAQTVRVEPTSDEKELYDRITALVKAYNADTRNGNRLLMKNLLAEAGSSPDAVAGTLEKVMTRADIPAGRKADFQAVLDLCRRIDDTRKDGLLLKLLTATPGKKIVFVKYTGTLDHISDFLNRQNIPHALFHGRMTNARKDEQIAAFQNDVDVLATTEIGGEGRNLQFCHQMINYDLPWNPMKIEQRIGRIHRIGQEKEVMIFNLCAAGSLEEYILEVLDKKINMFEMVIGEIDMILGRIRGEQDFSEIIYDIWTGAADDEDRARSFDQLAARLKRSKSQYIKTRELDDKLFGDHYEL